MTQPYWDVERFSAPGPCPVPAVRIVAANPAATGYGAGASSPEPALEEIARDSRAKAVVVLFSPAPAAQHSHGADLRALLDRFARCHKPLVAALDGRLEADHFALALACSARLIGATARIVPLQRQEMTARGSHYCSLRAAFLRQRWLEQGRELDAFAAVDLGLVDAVVEGDLRRAAIDYALTLAGGETKVG